jgi:hypothetical protein
MPFPTLGSGRVDKQLSNISLAITNEEFIHDKIFPVIPNLKEESGKIGQFDDAAHLRIYESIRAIGDRGQHIIEYKQTNSLTYQIEFHDLEKYLDDRIVEQFEKPFDARNDALAVLESSRNLEMETGLATTLADATILTATSTPSTLWDDPLSDPLGDMETAAEAVRLAIGRRPNKCWTNSPVISVLKTHPQFVAKLTGGGKLSVLNEAKVIEIIKEHLNVEAVHVGKAIKATSLEGQTLTKGEVWSDDFGLYYAPNKGSLHTPSFGYRFEMAGKNKRVSKRREPIGDVGDLIRLDWAFQDKLLMPTTAAYLLDQVIT